VRRVYVVAALLLGVVLVGVALTRVTRGDHSDAIPAATQPQPTVDPSGVDEGSGSAGIEAARLTAVRAVALTGDVVRAGPISRRELIASFTTARYGSTLARLTSDAVNAMLLELGNRDADPASLAVVEQPITASAAATASGIRVRVWSVLVVAVQGAGPGRQVWRTTSLDMVDAGDRWLVDGWSSTIGPSPAPPPEGVFDDADAFVEPLGWPPAGPSVSVAVGAE
jgi:hypothetical protein